MTLTWPMFAAALAGCRKAPEAAPEAVLPPPPPEVVAADGGRAPTVVEEMTRAFSARDAAPPCETVEAMSAAPVEDLLAIVDTVRLPPMAPMRAAGCLVTRHAEEAAAAIDAWMTGPETAGLARLATQAADTLPVPLALRFAGAALAGPHSADLEPLLRASVHPEVRALVEAP